MNMRSYSWPGVVPFLKGVLKRANRFCVLFSNQRTLYSKTAPREGDEKCLRFCQEINIFNKNPLECTAVAGERRFHFLFSQKQVGYAIDLKTARINACSPLNSELADF